ncbi:MAG TPA: cupin domain-containing protein [Longimicrobiales bacterium]|jgi:mannose-6-phosphate isomerase-like protein (cupin superfamily)
MRIRLPVVAALVLVPALAGATRFVMARPRPKIDYIPASEFVQRSDYAARTTTIGGTVAVSDDGQTVYMLVRRRKESDIEEHSRWDDILLVRSGTGAIEFSAKTRGAHLLAPGEIRGGELVSPESRVMHPGDMARIPAGTPHRFVPSGREPWELLIVKVRRGNLPLKRSVDSVTKDGFVSLKPRE